MDTNWTRWYRHLKKQVRMFRRSLRAIFRAYGFTPRKGPTVSLGWVPPDIP